ncbi:hypothetical protein CR513_41512, partial [Mucuna pruriens]
MDEVAPPYSPESNGVVERKNKNLKEIMNALLISSFVLDNLWGEALLITTTNEPKSEELRRSKRQRNETSYGDDFHTYLVEDDPMSFSEATSDSDLKLWEQAIRTEIDSIEKQYMETKEKNLLDLSLNPNGSIDKYKARLVAKGFTKKPDTNYFDTFILVIRISSIWVLIVLASIHKLVIHQIDVKIAFLNDDLEEEIYMTQLDGCVVSGQENKVCKLLKPLYGLKQAPK